MSFPLDSNGVPVCSREDIEIKAEEVLEYFSPEILKEPSFTPLPSIAKIFSEQFKVIFEFNADLGITKKGNKILGQFVTQPRAILIDRSIDINAPRWSFTLAHEIGHLVLHRHVRPDLGVEQYATLADTIEQLKSDLYFAQSRTAHQWLEWQANAFAASFLMPRQSFKDVFTSAMRDHEYSRGRGYVFLDCQRDNFQLFIDILGTLKDVFRVSSTAAEIRMKELSLLIDSRNRNSKQIAAYLREE